MSDDLVEAVARALYAYALEWGSTPEPEFSDGAVKSYWIDAARAALAAVEASGTHCVAPVKPTAEMQIVFYRAVGESILLKQIFDIGYAAMLSARPQAVGQVMIIKAGDRFVNTGSSGGTIYVGGQMDSLAAAARIAELEATLALFVGAGTHVLVPVIPTSEMIETGIVAHEDFTSNRHRIIRNTYSAMIAARPKNEDAVE